MLNLLTFKSINGLYKDKFWKNLVSTSSLVIVPSPNEADLLRAQLKNLEIISISNFLQNYTSDINLLKKSELLKLLSEIWNKTGQVQNFNQFKLAFDYFTEIRNNTNNFDSFSSVIETLRKQEQSFYYHSYSFLEENDFYDEARVINELKNEINKFERNHYIFWGFKFFNSNQVDFFNELSLERSVSIGIPEDVLMKSSHLDWANWIPEFEIIKIGNEQGKSPVNNYVENLSFKSDFINDQDILSVNNYEIEWIQSLGSEVYFKIDQGYFSQILQEIESILKSFLGKKILSLNIFLEKYLEESLIQSHYKQIKIVLLLIKQVEKFDSEKKFTFFDYHLMQSILELDLPRVFLVNFNEDYALYSLDELLYIGDKEIVCFYEQANTHSSDPHWSLPKETLKALGAIGAIKNTRLEDLYKDFFVEAIVFDETKSLIVDQKFYLENKKIQSYLEHLDLGKWTIKSNAKKIESYISLDSSASSERKYHSPTSLQSYIDCPRKYYFRYETNLTKPLESDDLMNSLERGRFEHLAIESYFKENVTPSGFRRWYEAYFLKFFAHKKINFKETSSLQEISYQRVSNGVKFVKELLGQFQEPEFFFEKEINKTGFKGFVDLHIIGNKKEAIIDFKSGQSSIPTVKAILELKKIQTLFYADKLIKRNNFIVGYYNLTTPSSSRILSTFPYEHLGGKKRANAHLMSTVEKYKEFEPQVIKSISEDRLFLATPQDDKSCSFCDFRNICLERQ